MGIVKVCEVCGKEFVAKHPLVKYCSEECRRLVVNVQKVAHYQAQKEGREKVAAIKCRNKTCFNYSLKKPNHCLGLTRVYEKDCPFFKTDEQYESETRKGDK